MTSSAVAQGHSGPERLLKLDSKRVAPLPRALRHAGTGSTHVLGANPKQHVPFRFMNGCGYRYNIGIIGILIIRLL